MNNARKRNAFTLIEVLIVVVIMAVLAATVIPQFQASTDDAKESSVKFNMHTLRSQIELYKIHQSSYPPIGAHPIDGTDSIPGLMTVTNGFGPYVDDIPLNSYDNKNLVTAVTTPGTAPTAPVGTDGGWLYDASTGGIWPNCQQYFDSLP